MKHNYGMKGIAAAAVLLSGLLASTAPIFAQGKEIVVGQLQFNPNMHPLIQVNNTKLNSMGYMNRPITAFDETETNVCRLCETVPTIESGLTKIVDRPDGKKGMEVTIKLREGLKWGDGVPVTTKDIAFTWQMSRDPKIGFSNYNPWSRADEVQIVDDRTIIMKLPAVIAGYDSWDQIVPEHLERTIYEAAPNAEEYIKQTLYNREPTNPGLWNGPFIPTDWRPGTVVVLQWDPLESTCRHASLSIL